MNENELKIELKHGSGGKDSRKLIKEVFLNTFNPDKNYKEEDAAIINNGELVFTTDSYVIQPDIFPGGNIGKLAVCGTLNDIAVRGGIPEWLSVGCIVSEGYSIRRLKEIASSMYATANLAGVSIVTGDTKVMGNKDFNGIILNTSGIGRLRYNSSIKNVRPSDDIIVTGTVGDHAASIIAKREGLFLDNLPPSDCAVLAPLLKVIFDSGIDHQLFVRDATRGGVTAVLQEIVEENNVSITIDRERVPISEPVSELASILGLDPLSMANEGKLIVVVPRSTSNYVLKAIRQHPLGCNATIIGAVKEEGNSTVWEYNDGMLKELKEGTNIPRIC